MITCQFWTQRKWWFRYNVDDTKATHTERYLTNLDFKLHHHPQDFVLRTLTTLTNRAQKESIVEISLETKHVSQVPSANSYTNPHILRKGHPVQIQNGSNLGC